MATSGGGPGVVYEIRGRRPVRRSAVGLKEHTRWVTSVAFNADGARLASGSLDSTVKLWDVKTGQLKATFLGHKRDVTSVAFNTDGTMLASGGGSGDGTVRLWDVKTGKNQATLQGHTY